MGKKRDFDEPPLEEMLADPIVRLVMKRDGIGPSDVLAVLDRARAGQKPSADDAADPADGVPPTRI